MRRLRSSSRAPRPLARGALILALGVGCTTPPPREAPGSVTETPLPLTTTAPPAGPPRRAPPPTQPRATPPSAVVVAPPSAPPAAPPSPSPAPPPSDVDAAAVTAALEAFVDTPELRTLRVGAAVADVATGAILAGHEADVRLNPASNEKLATTATALVLLGPDHTFEARVTLTDDGALVLSGGGDPSLTTEALATLAATTANAVGSAAVRVEVDEAPFTGASLPPGFDKKLTDAAYRAATAWTAIDEATYKVTLSPGRVGEPVAVEIAPPGDILPIENRGTTVAGKVRKIGVEPRVIAGRPGLLVRGRLGVEVTQRPVAVRRVEDPARVAGEAFRALLARAGVKVSRAVAIRRTPAQGRVVAQRTSESLAAIAAHVNKTSSNFGAEMLLRAIAVAEAARGQGAPDWATGAGAILRTTTQTLGLSPDAIEVHNGSGLYDGGRVSPSGLVRLLVAMQGHPAGPAFDASLSVAGVDGTLAARLGGPATLRKVRGKTGTLDDVSSLAGYVPTQSGRLLAFALIVNGRMKSAAPARKAQDALVTALARLP